MVHDDGGSMGGPLWVGLYGWASFGQHWDPKLTSSLAELGTEPWTQYAIL